MGHFWTRKGGRTWLRFDILAAYAPRPILIDADAVDLEDRADHLNKVLSALLAYMAVTRFAPVKGRQ
jgi:hypothetical protein